VTDGGAVEHVLGRLLAVKWDDDEGAYRHRRSRGRLTREYLRRSAQWAQALRSENGWPFSDLASAVDPETRADPALVQRLVASVGDDPVIGPLRRTAEAALQWAALGDLPKQRFPQLDDPYEPFLTLLERGGGFMVANGFIELGYGAFPIGSVAERAALEPVAIDRETLDELDRSEGN
jgi:hypothetical protein